MAEKAPAAEQPYLAGDTPSVPAWRTCIRAESADYTIARVRRAGGSVVATSWAPLSCQPNPTNPTH